MPGSRSRGSARPPPAAFLRRLPSMHAAIHTPVPAGRSSPPFRPSCPRELNLGILPEAAEDGSVSPGADGVGIRKARSGKEQER